MTQAIGRFAVASLLMCLSHGVADAQDVATPWDVCLKAPVRACVLEIAEEQLTAGLLDRAEATFGEALSLLVLSQKENPQPNLELYVIRVVQGDRTTRFIAASATLRPQIVQIAQLKLFYAGGRRAEILRNIADVLPN
jgi:hypothetical protein